MQRSLKRTSLLLFAAFIVSLYTPWTSSAAVDVYLEGAYTETDLTVYIYADINPAVLSYGVKLTYSSTELNISTAEKNESVWFMGDGTTNHAYMDPETSTPGEVIIIGGKLDTNAPTAGVTGDRVLLGKVVFNRTENSMPFAPALSVSLGRSGRYNNFVQPDGAVMDSTGVNFTTNTILERGDANADGYLTSLDMFEMRNLISAGTYTIYADCNNDGVITSLDMFCLRNKL